jgi:hypothetical protein
MRPIYVVTNGVYRQVAALEAVILQSRIDFKRYGKRLFRHRLLREVTASEVIAHFPKLPEKFRRELSSALKRSTRAWLTRHPNLRKGEHIRRCRELWAALETFSPKVVVA